MAIFDGITDHTAKYVDIMDRSSIANAVNFIGNEMTELEATIMGATGDNLAYFRKELDRRLRFSRHVYNRAVNRQLTMRGAK